MARTRRVYGRIAYHNHIDDMDSLVETARHIGRAVAHGAFAALEGMHYCVPEPEVIYAAVDRMVNRMDLCSSSRTIVTAFALKEALNEVERLSPPYPNEYDELWEAERETLPPAESIDNTENQQN